MFRATMCPSSGEETVFMRHLVLIILYGWLSGMQGGIYSTLHTRQLSIQNNKYQGSHKYSCFSRWWAYNRPKHAEKINKHNKKNCAPSWLHLQDYTRIHGQQNMKNIPFLKRYPCTNESAMRRMWQKNTAGRQHRRWGGHAAGNEVLVCCSSDFDYASLYIHIYTVHI
jgi:hypothetical protein